MLFVCPFGANDLWTFLLDGLTGCVIHSGASSCLALRVCRPLKEDEWACTDAKCATVNPKYRNQCSACGKSKPRQRTQQAQMIGKEQAEKSKGLFSAEDWACSKCGNVNWARRNTCNMCNAPKHVEMTPRTGYGGGFMDREEVQYKTKEELGIVEQYDEFGRVIKKRTAEQEAMDDDMPAHAAKSSKPTDEDDDEGNEADLEKYDLDWDEIAPIKKKKDTGKTKAEQSPAAVESDCSCSCSGGSCSCSEPEDNKIDDVKVAGDGSSKDGVKSKDRLDIADRHRNDRRRTSRSRSPRDRRAAESHHSRRHHSRDRIHKHRH